MFSEWVPTTLSAPTNLAKISLSMGKPFLHEEIINGWKERGNWWNGFKMMTDSLFLNTFFFFSPSCLDIGLLFSNLFFSCLIFPQLWQYSWSQTWVHYLKMPAVEAGKQVGKITRGISEAWDKGRKHINTALTEQQVPS